MITHRHARTSVGTLLLALFVFAWVCWQQHAFSEEIEQVKTLPTTWAELEEQLQQLQGQGKYNQLLEVAKRGLEAAKREYPENAIQIAEAWTWLRTGYYQSSQYEQVKEASGNALRIAKLHFKEWDPDLVPYYLAVASIDYHLNDARQLNSEIFQKSKEVLEKNQRTNNMNYIAALFGLARTANDNLEVDRAIELYKALLGKFDAFEATPSQKVELTPLRKVELVRWKALSLADLGGLLIFKNQLKAGVKYLERAHELALAELDPNHPEICVAKRQLSVGYREQGKYPQALELIEEALQICLESLNSIHLDVGLAYGVAGTIHGLQGEFELAEKYLRLAHDIVNPLVSKNDLSIAAYESLLGQLAFTRGELEQAELLLLSSLKRMEAKVGPKHIGLAVVLEQIILTYTAQKATDQAARYQQQLDSLDR